MRILFMGTPDFAVASLEALVSDGHDVCGVFTQPDRPKGRGHKTVCSPVKEYALARGIPVFQPLKMRDGTALATVRELAPELIVVAAYGRILPDDILSAPPYGAINVHASLLPRWRGASPVNQAVLHGDNVTGVTIMYMASELDAGDMLLTVQTPIDPEEDAAELMARLAPIGARALIKAVRAIADGTARRVPQPAEGVTYAPMLDKSLSPVVWTESARSIHDQIRGLVPWPCAAAVIDGVALKLYASRVGGDTTAPAGTVLSASKRGIEIACGDGRSLLLTQLQPEGGKRMSAAAYLAGHKVQVGL